MGTSVDFRLPQHLTLSNVQALHEKLNALVQDNQYDDIVLCGSEVSRADTAGIQLLAAFVQSAKERQINLDWQEPSDKLINAASVLGAIGALLSIVLSP